VLQDKKIFRVGGNVPVEVDVRLIAASNQDLEAVVQGKNFRRDLFYRLNEFTIQIPPLRNRREDIPYLAKMFLDTVNLELGKDVKGFTEYAIESLLNYEWPGNVRQLRSTIRRAALLADEMITEKDLEMKRAPVPGLQFTPRVQGQPWHNLSLREILRRSAMAVEREIIGQVLKQTGGNKAKAARILKIDYKTMHTKLKSLGLKPNGGEA
jgi:two-component system nitrogen regulation response regulator GlnG